MEETNYIHLREPEGLTECRRRMGRIGLCFIGLAIMEGSMINTMMSTSENWGMRNVAMVHFISTYTMGLLAWCLAVELGYHVEDERTRPIIFDWFVRHRRPLMISWVVVEACMLLTVIPLSAAYRGILMVIIICKIGLLYLFNRQLAEDV